MDVSEIHLEKALDEYNSKVNGLENEGPSYELVEAYVNRGCVLYMLGYNTSAMEDLTAASEMIDSLEADGSRVDPGTYVKAHSTMGAILFEQRSEVSEEYSYAISRLNELRSDSKHFDRAGIIRMCIESAENLIDSEYSEDAEEFIIKGLSLISKLNDDWSNNRKMELHTLMGECKTTQDQPQEAIESYSKAIEVGTMLVDGSGIEDMEELVVPIIARAHCESDLDLTDLYIKDLELAIGLMEEMLSINKLENTDVLVNLHQDVAAAYMSKGKMEEAEKHLMNAVSMGVHGAKDYLMNQTNGSY